VSGPPDYRDLLERVMRSLVRHHPFDHDCLADEKKCSKCALLHEVGTALRVVPPEGADNAVHLTVAWNAFSRAWPYETTPTLRDALFVAVETALESAALRASGAGTRQEEPQYDTSYSRDRDNPFPSPKRGEPPQ
jgi:hypothetical protein